MRLFNEMIFWDDIVDIFLERVPLFRFLSVAVCLDGSHLWTEILQIRFCQTVMNEGHGISSWGGWQRNDPHSSLSLISPIFHCRFCTYRCFTHTASQHSCENRAILCNMFSLSNNITAMLQRKLSTIGTFNSLEEKNKLSVKFYIVQYQSCP